MNFIYKFIVCPLNGGLPLGHRKTAQSLRTSLQLGLSECLVYKVWDYGGARCLVRKASSGSRVHTCGGVACAPSRPVRIRPIRAAAFDPGQNGWRRRPFECLSCLLLRSRDIKIVHLNFIIKNNFIESKLSAIRRMLSKKTGIVWIWILALVWWVDTVFTFFNRCARTLQQGVDGFGQKWILRLIEGDQV